MNNTFKTLALAIPMVLLSGCGMGNSLSEKEFEIEKTKRDGVDVLKFTCKADEPIMIKSISVNGNAPSFPQHTAPITQQYVIAFSMNQNVFRWQKDSWFKENNVKPIEYPCAKGQWDVFVDTSGVMGYNDIVEVKIETTNRGINTYTW
jgi:hypothetical protein